MPTEISSKVLKIASTVNAIQKHRIVSSQEKNAADIF
jgi:hypothetical protein